MKREIIAAAAGLAIILALALTGCAGTEQSEVTGPGFHIIFKGKQTEAKAPTPTAETKPVNPFKPPTLPPAPAPTETPK